MKKILLITVTLLFILLLSAQQMTAPHNENFDTMAAGATVAPQNGWSRHVYNPAFANATVNIGTQTPFSSPNVARLYTNNSPDAQIMLISPEAINLVESRIRFMARIQGSVATAPPTLIIGFMTNPADASSFEPVQTIRSLSTAYQQFQVSFQGYDFDEEDRYYIAFKHGISTETRAILIDNFSYEALPTIPVFAVSPTSKNFGTVHVGNQSAPQTFTVSNDGIGILQINSISLSGTDPADYQIIDQPESFPVTLQGNQSLSVSVIFVPGSAGPKSANLSFVDDLDTRAVRDVPLSGTGFVPPIGATHQNPILITLPEFQMLDVFNDYGNDYATTWVSPTQSLLTGTEVVFQFTITEDSFVSCGVVVSLSHGGVMILDQPPNQAQPAPVLAVAGGENGGSLSNIPLMAGTYYVFVMSFLNFPPNNNVTFNFNFSAVSAGPTTLLATPANHAYGFIPLGQSASQAFTLSNPGGGTVSIESILMTTGYPDDFSYTAPALTYPINLTVGQSVGFSVGFAPSSPGAKNATILITYDLQESRPQRTTRHTMQIALDGSGYLDFAGGSGTENDPYLISEPSHLNSIRYHLGVPNRSKHFLQISDLDFDIYPYNTGLGWDPIGYYFTDTNFLAFTGTYNGNGFTISNLYINRPDLNQVGLFGVIEGATVKNTHLINTSNRGRSRIGSLIGYVHPNFETVPILTRVTNCSAISGTISGQAFIGGLIGWNGRGTVSKCHTDIFVTIAPNMESVAPEGKVAYGGLVGSNMSTGVVEYCYTLGNVVGFTSVGGMIGYQSQALVFNSYSRGNVTAESTFVGGLVGGNLFMSNIDRCFSTGVVSAQPGMASGGLLGAQMNLSDTASSYWDMETSGMSTSAGSEAGRTTADMTYPYVNSYIPWNFSTIWQNDPDGEYNSRYPYLRWQEPSAPPPTPQAPIVSISRIGNQLSLTWNAVAGAGYYNVYSSDEPVNDSWGAPTGGTTGTVYTIPAGSGRRFFKVTASSIAP